jgi:hypothetical protein
MCIQYVIHKIKNSYLKQIILVKANMFIFIIQLLW